MKNGFHEGTIGIPQKDGSSKIAHYWVKAYARESEWGINGGKISKLAIRIDGEWTANYDRGWDIEPVTENAQLAVAAILHSMN